VQRCCRSFALIQQFLDQWGSKRILYLTGDREFIGADWVAWLKRARVPFRLRLRMDDLVRDRKGKTYEVATLFSRSVKCRKGQFLLWGTWVYLGGKPLSHGDYLVIASSDVGNLLEDYRNRWSIECLFQALKGRGFHLEETRVVEPDRLSRLFGLLTLGYLLCVCIGQSLPQTICKATKRARKSIARQGLEVAHRVALWLLGPPSALDLRWFLQAFTPCKT
jgi:Transposase DDE domain